MTPPVRIGTRGSALALVQARLVAAALDVVAVSHEIVVVETAGDRRAPDTAWGEGAFVKAIEQELLDGRVDVAVHSAKDVPTEEDTRLAIAAFLPRADPRDAIVLQTGAPRATLETLPTGSRVGTDSPRRGAFVLALRPDLVIVPIHGNVDTRLRRLDAGEADALVLAVAGLERLGCADRIAEALAPDRCPPAPGQGAVAVQVRAADTGTRTLVARADHKPTRVAVELERALLAAMGGGCRSPIGALAVVDGEMVAMLAGAAGGSGGDVRHQRVEGRVADGARLIADLSVRLRPVVSGRRVLVTRAAEGADRLGAALVRLGIEAVAVPAIATVPVPSGGELDAVLSDPGAWDQAVVTSPTGARAVLDTLARIGGSPGCWRWAVVGPTTAAVLAAAGVTDIWLPVVTRSEGVGEELPLDPGERVLLLRGDLAGDRLPDRMAQRGAHVRQVLAYHTLEAPPGSDALLRAALGDGPFDAVLFASGSAVRGIVALGEAVGWDARAVPAICLGPETAAEAHHVGFRVLGEAPMQSADALAALAASLLHPATQGASG